MTSKVSLRTVEEGDVYSTVKDAMTLVNWKGSIHKGAHVVVKPNVCWDKLLPGCQTSPIVLKSVITILRDHVSSVTIVESDSVVNSAEKGFELTRIKDVAEATGSELVNLSKEERFEKVRLEEPLFFTSGSIDVPKCIHDADHLITVPVMKTHVLTTVSGALKNQYGCLRKIRYTYHLNVDDVIVDINMALRPDLAVMDATIAMEGEGPNLGKPRKFGAILASKDMVAMDSIEATLMGFDPMEIQHITKASQRGLGNVDKDAITVLGEEVRSLEQRFEPAHGTGIVSRLNLWTLGNSILKPIVYDTPLFQIFRGGTVLYNDSWYFLKGRKYLKEILKDDVYGRQWRK